MRLSYKYVRIQGLELAANTMYAKGIFSMCWQLIQNDVMDEEDIGLFKEIDSWFAENLPWPPQCKNREKVVCFFEKYNHPYYLVYTNMPGEIVYEDKYQVVVKVSGKLQIEELQPSWSPDEAKAE